MIYPAPSLAPIARRAGGISPLWLNLAAGWQMDETGGNRIDVTGGGSDLTPHGGVTTTPGIIGNAVRVVRENSQYLDAPITPRLQTGDVDFAVSLFMRVLSTSGGGTAVISVYNGSVVESSWAIYMPLLGWVNALTVTGSTQVVGTAVSISMLAWNHVVFWKVTSTGQAYLAVNDGTPSEWHAGLQNPGNTPFVIGRNPFAGAAGYVTADLDLVYIFKNRVLTAADRTALYNGGAGRAYPN